MSGTTSSEKMNPVPDPRYYVISFIEGETAPAPRYCVPESWVTLTDEGRNEAMVAYPDEPWKTVEERARRCDDPQETWKSLAAHVRGVSNHFSSLICSEDEGKDVEGSGVPIMWTQPGPSCSSKLPLAEPTSKNSPEAASQVGTRDDLESLIPELLKAYENLRAEMDETRRPDSAEDSEDSECELLNDVIPLLITWARAGRGVLIKETDLDECKQLARSCLHLARMLTRAIFSDEALKKCIYVGKDAPRRDLTLDEGAVVAIVNYVWTFGLSKNWKLPSERSIRNAIRYELLTAKEKNTQ